MRDHWSDLISVRCLGGCFFEMSNGCLDFYAGDGTDLAD
jgi:hypothetical protein